jgi:hypothetical protein
MEMRFILVASCAFFASLVRAEGGDVVALTESTFDDKMAGYEIALVKFYAP